jgi:hypothetical protein
MIDDFDFFPIGVKIFRPEERSAEKAEKNEKQNPRGV